MKKAKTAAALLCSACLVLSGTAVPTMADSVKVVTLGADLTQDQKNTMMKYFNVDSNQAFRSDMDWNDIDEDLLSPLFNYIYISFYHTRSEPEQ